MRLYDPAEAVIFVIVGIVAWTLLLAAVTLTIMFGVIP
jgi:hypothetical protein